MSVQTTVGATVTMTASVPKDSEQPFVRAVPHVRIIVPAAATESTYSRATAIVPVRVRMAATSRVREVTSLVKDKVVTSLVKDRVATSLARDRVAISLVRDRVDISLVRDRVATSHAKDRAAISPVKVVRVVMASPIRSSSLMASPTTPTRKVPVSIRPTMIRMPSIA